MDLSRYSKVIAAVVGNLVGAALVWASFKTPMAQCGLVEAKQVCTLLGMGEGEITAIVLMIVNGLFVGFGPKNTITNAELVKEVASKTDLVDGLKLKNTIEGRAINAETPANVSIAATPVAETKQP